MNFEIGKWYISDAWNSFKYTKAAKWFGKADEFWYFSEYIASDIDEFTVKYVKGNWYNKGNFREVSIDEIQQYLPIDHPDRKSNKVDTTDYKYLTSLLKKLNIR